MEEFQVDIVEQPVRSDDYAGLAAVKAATTALVEADESAGTLADVYRLAVAGCVDATVPTVYVIATPGVPDPTDSAGSVSVSDRMSMRMNDVAAVRVPVTGASIE